MAGRNLFAPKGRDLFAEPRPIAPPLSGMGPEGQDIPWQQQEPTTPKPYQFKILPFTQGASGENTFDVDVGLPGVIKRGVTLPGEVIQGEINPDSPEGRARMLEAAAIFTPMGAASRAASSAYRSVAPKAPTREALEVAKKAGYDKAADLGVEYKSAPVGKMVTDLQRSLDEQGFFAELAPEVHTLIGKLQNPPPNSKISLKALDAFRKRLGELAGSPDATKASAATQAIKAVDEFITSADSANVVARAAPGGAGLSRAGETFASADEAAAASTAREAARTIEAARADAAAGFRSDKVTGLEDVIGLRSAAANSGRNLDNTARQRLTSLLLNKKGIRGFSTEEKLAIRDIIKGTPTKNAARYIGNLFGGGGGLGQFLSMFGLGTVGGATAGGLGAAAGIAAPMAIGTLGKALANRMTKAELKHLDELVRSRSATAGQPGQRVFLPSAGRETMARALAYQSATNPDVRNMNKAPGVNKGQRRALADALMQGNR